jgi:RNA polymerase sigma-70 factor (sigma-E family)
MEPDGVAAPEARTPEPGLRDAPVPDERIGASHQVECREGQAFDGFYVEMWAWAVRVASLITQDREAGEEIAQECLLSLYQRWGEVERPKAYLRRALVNRCSNWQRQRRTDREKLPLLVGPETADLGASDLADAIAALSPRQRAVLVLRYYAGLPEADIAAALGCRPGTVKSLSARGLRRLRKSLPDG